MLDNLHPTMKRAFITMFVAFFLLIIATFYTIYLTRKNYEPVMDPMYYEKGLNYDKVIAETREMKTAGYLFKSSIFDEPNVLKKGKNDIKVGFFLKDEPISDAQLSLKIEKSATAKFSKEVKLMHVEKGIHVSEVEFPLSGQWMLTITGVHKGKTMLKTFSVEIPDA